MPTAEFNSDDLPTGMTVDEFLAWTEDRPGRYELFAGRVFAIAPERAGHAETKFAVQSELERAIETAGLFCHMMPDGMTVRIEADTAHEPDALVYCGEKVAPDAVEIANPVIVVEVLSPSTRRVDASAKLDGYFSVTSVQHYLIIDPDRRRLIQHRRHGEATILTGLHASGTIHLDPPGLDLDVVRCFG